MASERFQRRIERLLDEADEALARYDWEAVRQAAQTVLAIDPENGDGLTFLATVERALASTTGSSSTQQQLHARNWPLCLTYTRRNHLTVYHLADGVNRYERI